MKKWLIGVLCTAAIMVIAAAAISSESAENIQPAFTGEFTVNHNGQIAFVLEEEQMQVLYKQTESGVKRVFEADEDREIKSPVFTEENNLSFIHTTGYPPEPEGEQKFQLEYSDVVQVEGEDTDELVSMRGVMTDLVVDPTHDRLIIGGILLNIEEAPQEGFIPYSSSLHTLEQDGTLEEIRSFDAYSPDSLQLKEGGENLLMILPDDFENVTPDSMFESTDRIYEMNMDNPQSLKLVSDEDTEIPISEVVISPDNSNLLFQTIMNWNESGDYEYDMVQYDPDLMTEGKRLHIDDSVMNAEVHNENLYYIKMSRNTNGSNKYALFRFDLASGEEEQINLISP
ncbi:hypothetical protein [Alteribacillus sp. YIM 98480]|uniref:hypothetical protein n=1 Tax=Alteribacillus sp. YIM 98480 TaxID=2606599 RepID=UPI00131A9ED9|nr:hypothetical protein [Alteribacillus sp. YIM 98480]